MIDEHVEVVCWLWNGWRPGEYNYRHVNRLYRMLQKHMTGSWGLTCICEDPTGIECRTFPLWIPPPILAQETIYSALEPVVRKKFKSTSPTIQYDEAPGIVRQVKVIPNCFTRLRIFDPRVGSWIGKLLLSIDIDVNVVADLRPLLTADGFKGARGRHSPILGGLWQLRVGAHPEIWTDFDPLKSPALIAGTQYEGHRLSGSDQGWLSIKLPGCPAWTTEDGIYDHLHIMKKRPPENARVIQTWGSTKPWLPDTRLCYPFLYDPLPKDEPRAVLSR